MRVFHIQLVVENDDRMGATRLPELLVRAEDSHAAEAMARQVAAAMRQQCEVFVWEANHD